MSACGSPTIGSTGWVEIDWADQDGVTAVPTAVVAWFKTPGQDPVDVSGDVDGSGTLQSSYVTPEFERPGLHQLAIQATVGPYRDNRVVYWHVPPSDFAAVL